MTWLLLGVVLVSCGSNDHSGEFYTDWDLAGGCSSDTGGADRLDAEDQAVDVCAGDGRWVWVSYAAAWCSASRRQAPVLSRLARTAPHDALFYTVLTSGTEVFTAASQADARAWARDHGFATGRVLRDPEGGGRSVPQHLLIGPDGHTWYRYVGALDADAIASLLDEFANGTRTPDVRDLGVR